MERGTLSFPLFPEYGEEAACDGLTDLGVRVYFQQVPGEKEIEWAEVR